MQVEAMPAETEHREQKLSGEDKSGIERRCGDYLIFSLRLD